MQFFFPLELFSLHREQYDRENAQGSYKFNTSITVFKRALEARVSYRPPQGLLEGDVPSREITAQGPHLGSETLSCRSATSVNNVLLPGLPCSDRAFYESKYLAAHLHRREHHQIQRGFPFAFADLPRVNVIHCLVCPGLELPCHAYVTPPCKHVILGSAARGLMTHLHQGNARPGSPLDCTGNITPETGRVQRQGRLVQSRRSPFP